MSAPVRDLADRRSEAETSMGPILTTLRCASPDCRKVLVQVPFAAPAGVVRVPKCSGCGESSTFVSTPYGVVAQVG